jgi:CRP/FNR family transcriptional regulator, dissimilatory nitrate respiration regulator
VARAAADAVLAALGRVDYFRSVPAAELARLARRCRQRDLKRGEHAFETGEACRGLLVVAEGSVEMRQVSSRGREQVLHAEGAGATLGEAPLFDGQGYIASAIAVGPTSLVLIPKETVLDLCRRHPAVAIAMLEAMAKRVRRFAGLVEDLAFRQVTERLARHLEGIVAASGVPVAPGTVVDLGLTQEQLAGRLGTVRERVSRALSQLERAGAIKRSRSGIVIRDPGRLAEAARGDAPA